MQSAEIGELAKQEKTYWWHVSRRVILQSVLSHHAKFISASFHCHPGPTGQRPSSDSGSRPGFPIESGMTVMNILDVGCGTGENFKWLQNFGEVTGVDSSEVSVALANSVVCPTSNAAGVDYFIPRAQPRPGRAQSRGYISEQVVLGRAEDLPVEDKEFNLVTAFDVLEHVTDERRVLGEWGRVLSLGGLLFISVPAYQWLFGPHDRALMHYRRYNLSGLIKLLKDNGWQPLFSSYIFCLTFPLFLCQRWLAKFSRRDAQQYIAVPPWINSILIGLGKLEASWLRFGKLPFGSSIVVLARKND